MRRSLLSLVLMLSLVAGNGLPSPSPSATIIPHAAAPAPTTPRPDGAELLHVPDAPASAQNPAFSPGDTRLVFTRFDEGYNDGPASLFLLDLTGHQVARLTPSEDQDNVNLPGAAWDATSNRIVFASDRLEADDLWRIAPDGTDLSRITTHSGLPAYIEPSWSPDGQWIAFEASQPGASEDGRVGQIWKVRSDGTALTKLTGAPGFDDRQPNWSPTGDRIVFQRRVPNSDDWNLYTITPDGTDVRSVCTTSSSDTDASWSPDGRWIVYSSDYGRLPVPNIFIIPAAGGTPIRVTYSDTHADGAPSWSPALPNSGSAGGQWIAFESHLGQDETSPATLWRIPAPISFTYLPLICKK